MSISYKHKKGQPWFLKDCVIGTYSPVKKGGWSMQENKGIEIVHKPTGIHVKHHSKRSQHANRALCIQSLEEILGPQGGFGEDA